MGRPLYTVLGTVPVGGRSRVCLVRVNVELGDFNGLDVTEEGDSALILRPTKITTTITYRMYTIVINAHLKPSKASHIPVYNRVTS